MFAQVNYYYSTVFFFTAQIEMFHHMLKDFAMIGSDRAQVDTEKYLL